MTKPKIFLTALIVIVVVFSSIWIINATTDRIYFYPTYVVNDGKDIMVKLPCGTGINTNLTKEDLETLISNPLAGISPQCAKEILDYLKVKI